MANYSTTFDSLATGAGVPSGFTSRWDAGTWAINDASGDHYLRESSASGSRYFVSMDAVDGDADRANVEVLTRVRVSDMSAGSQTYIGAILRGSGNGTSETGYGVLVVTGSPNLRITKYSAATNTTLATSASPITFAANTWYWIRARANGTSIKGKVWADGASEPGTWDVEVTDSAISAAGWNGAFGFIGGVNKDFGDIAIATNGDTAAMASGATIDCGVAAASASGFAAGISAGSTTNCGVAAADAAGLTATIYTGATVDCGLGAADAAGHTAVVATASAVDCAVASASAAGFTADIQTYAIKDDYERSSVNLTGSSVSGSGDAAIISIKPRVQESEVKSSQTAWLEPSAKIIGVNGVRPTFRFLDYAATWVDGKYHGAPWGATRRPMFSYDDGLTWQYFDTKTVNGTYIEFRHNTAFTADTVRVGRSRQISVEQTGAWIDALAATYPAIIGPTTAAAAFTPTLTSWSGQQFIADEYSAQTNELGATIPATPLYAFKIQDDSLAPLNGEPKRMAVLTGGVHAGEDMATYTLVELIDWLLGASAEAQRLRRDYVILVYPAINAPGRAGGGWRGSYTQGTAGADDANRHFHESGSGLEIVNKPKTVFTTDRAGAVPDWMIDFHGAFETVWGVFLDTGDGVQGQFRTRLATNGAVTVTDLGTPNVGFVSNYWKTVGVKLAITHETGDPTPVSDAEITAHGAAIGVTLDSMVQDGTLGVHTTLATATAGGFSADIVVPNTVDCGVAAAAASGHTAVVASPSTIDCAVAAGTAAGLLANIATQVTVDATLGAAAAAGYTAAIEVAFTIYAGLAAAEAAGHTANVSTSEVIECALAAASAAGRPVTFGSGVTLSQEDINAIAAAVLAALQATTIPVDVQKTNGVEIIGDGTELNKFRSIYVG